MVHESLISLLSNIIARTDILGFSPVASMIKGSVVSVTLMHIHFYGLFLLSEKTL